VVSADASRSVVLCLHPGGAELWDGVSGMKRQNPDGLVVYALVAICAHRDCVGVNLLDFLGQNTELAFRTLFCLEAWSILEQVETEAGWMLANATDVLLATEV